MNRQDLQWLLAFAKSHSLMKFNILNIKHYEKSKNKF